MSKKTLEMLIEAKADYLVKVKGNQPKLFKNISAKSYTFKLRTTERNRGRRERRSLSVCDKVSDIAGWKGLKQIWRIKRWGTREGKRYSTVSYYICSAKLTAQKAMDGIRGHWCIENKLHYVKDTVFQEDKSKIKDTKAAANMAMLRNWAINVYSQNDYKSLTKALRANAYNIDRLCHLLE